ncbi:MAG: transcription-repair coupling factor [Nitrospirae bacterium]|nr:transcription-repair coupling factor [Nitrospirota bacterium]
MAPPQPPYWDQFLRPILDALRDHRQRPCLTGLHGSTTAFALTLLAKGRVGAGGGKSWLIVTASDEDAERLYDDLRFFYAMLGLSPEALALFPEWETLPYEATPPHVELIARRMRTLHRLTERGRTVLVTSVPALIQRLLPLSVFSEACLQLRPGATVERDALTSRLLRLGYRCGSVVEILGEFSIRGGIVDIYSTAYLDPLRVEFLGDTVESVRFFDTATQKSTAKLDHAWLLPARELIYPEQWPESLEALPPDAEWRGPEIYPSMETLLDYFSEAPILALDQPQALAKKATDFQEEAAEAYARRGSDADTGAYPTPDRLYLPWKEILDRTRSWACLATAPVAALEATWHPSVTFPAQSPSSVGLALRGTPFTESLARLDRLRSAGPALIVARSRGQIDRLLALFAEHNLPAAVWTPQCWSSVSSHKPPFYLLHGDLSAGFVSAEGRLAVITEEELFAKGMRHRPPPKSKAATFLSSLEDLNAGDYVVHVQHGIGRYQGLRRLSVQGFESDYLVLEFAGGDKLYVPLDRLNQVQRYTGAEGHVPRMDRLGGTSWARMTARVKQGIEEMAQELVELYANREVIHRSEYDVDSTLTHEFEAAFEYEETEDQLRAIEDIKRDLESPKPMDRLVCGDVGYGKTEVAMRAAFKAVENNRQVAILTPTTLLAQQHHDNFAQRFAPFPARVAMLSRFRTPKEIKAVLRDLATGTVDVVIGTHRLLQQDVQFRNLGLVIIDEEQWFGVRHKERLKQLRTQVDVLTLTATPIPRTLQMAMSGVRDLSVIETPPAGRLAIRTQVVRFSEPVIREAIIRELGRGGQVFFVHNRVQTMERMATWLQQLVPEARIVMAHGQMDERLLESVMLTFLRREADVLVASAIIQSGLDVPNANTILVNRADTFGLAQLYQLRGRVGRAGHQAYAYFLVPDDSALSEDAQKRLVAIHEFTELGSGFRIAAADLEIRGAGNLLGKQQSGHIAAVGLDLYLQMVEQAVQQVMGTVVEEELDPTLHLNVSAFIPEEYVADAHQRLSLYKRLASCLQVGDLALLHGEIQDRYGPLPDPVERLFEVIQIRLLAKSLRLSSVEVKPGAPSTVVIAFDPKAPVPEAGIRQLMDRYHRRFRLLSPQSFELQMPPGDWLALFPELNAALQTLAFCGTKRPAAARATS